jgi:hypothetical protein
VTRRLRAVVRAEEREAGITLVELLVASMVTVVLLALMGNLLLIGSKTTTAAHYQNKDTGTASNIMNEISTAVRFGTNIANSTPTATPAIVSAGKEWLILYTFEHADEANPQPVMVEFVVDPATRNVVEKTWSTTISPDGFFTFPEVTDKHTVAPAIDAAPKSTRILGGPVSTAPTGKDPLFTYTGPSGVVGWENDYEASSLGTNLALIATVNITVRVATGQPNQALPVELYGSAALQVQGIGA